MKRSFCLTLLSAVLLICSGMNRQTANAQPVQLQHLLTLHGFENVAVSTAAGGQLVITFENRIYRSQAQAIASVLSIAGGKHTEAETFKLIILQNRQPVLVLKTDSSRLQAFLNGEISYRAWAASAELTLNTRRTFDDTVRNRSGSEMQQRSRFRPVFPVGLGMRYQLGNYNEPYRFAFDLEPEISLPLTRGLDARVRYAIPLHNNFDDNTHVRPSLATLTQTFVPDDGIFIAISGGLFGRNRYGVHTALKAFLLEEILSITLDTGYTEFTSISGRVDFPRFENRPFTFYTISADYRLRRYDLNTRVQFGRFLYSDDGVRVDVHRHFGEVQLGFFGISSRLGNNAGFFISLPLNPARYRDLGPLRVRPAERFPVTYRYRGNDFRGRTYETGIRFDQDLMKVYPSYLIKEMEQYF